MDRQTAVEHLQSMGFQLEASDDVLRLRLDGFETTLPVRDDWQATVREAGGWLDALSRDAGEQAKSLARRRRVAGFRDLEAFCAFTGLDPVEVFESEAGLRPPANIHTRVLDWLESGELRPRSKGA